MMWEMLYLWSLILAGGLTEYLRWRCRRSGKHLNRWPNNTRRDV